MSMYPEGIFSPLVPETAGLYIPWECTRMADHVPPLPLEADKIFQAARALEKSGKLSSNEEEEVFEGYQKAAALGHWKAMNNLMVCYLYGRGTDVDYAKALVLADQLIALDVGSGWYARYIMHKNGWGLPADEELADTCLHRAADEGESHAQYELGYYYLYPARRHIQGLRYLVCAVRQGHGEAAYKIGKYLEIKKNYYMAVEYYYRGAALGHYMAALDLAGIFHPNYKPDDTTHNLGFQVASPELYKAFYGYYHLLEKNPGTCIPDLFQKHPLPPNAVMSREQSRAMPSPLRDAYDGTWPDESFPDLAPDYLPPKL